MVDYLCKDAHTGMTASVMSWPICGSIFSEYTLTRLVLMFTHALFHTSVSRVFIFVGCFVVISEHGKIGVHVRLKGSKPAEEVWLCAH